MIPDALWRHFAKMGWESVKNCVWCFSNFVMGKKIMEKKSSTRQSICTRLFSSEASWNWRIWYQLMMTSSNGNIFRVTGPLCGESIGYRWISLTKTSDARSFDVFFDVRPNKLLSKQWKCRRFETPWRSLWRRCNVHAGMHLRYRQQNTGHFILRPFRLTMLQTNKFFIFTDAMASIS